MKALKMFYCPSNIKIKNATNFAKNLNLIEKLMYLLKDIEPKSI